MPGPVSDSYDPEFGTGANAHDVRSAIKELVEEATVLLGENLEPIVQVAQGPMGRQMGRPLTVKQWRVLRFACNRALESI